MTEQQLIDPSLADKLDRLFKTVHPRGRPEYTYEQIANGIRERGGPTISGAYIWQLRKGIQDNPRKKHLEALADFFDITPAYFLDKETGMRLYAQLELLAAMREAQVQHLALRAAGLTPEGIRAIAHIIEHTRQIEGLLSEEAGDPRREAPQEKSRGEEREIDEVEKVAAAN